jgi:calcineurin-like phosphoesterase family protein
VKIELKPQQQVWFTSDTHYNHSNICRATTTWTDADNVTRDFPSLQEMNEKLISSINEHISQDDILIHLGDWSFGGFESIQTFRDRIICQNIHLVLGNHDHHIERDKDNIRSIFSSVNHYLELEIVWEATAKIKERQRFVLMHYPIASWNGMNEGVIHLHGHVHLPNHLRISKGKAMDVGVDGNGLNPISMGEVIKIMNKQHINSLSIPKDHHVKII